MLRPLRLLLAACATLLAVCAIPVASAPADDCTVTTAPAGAGFVGMVAPDVLEGTTSYRRCGLSNLAGSGVGMMRVGFQWSGIELQQGRYNFEGSDPVVADLARRQIQALGLLDVNIPRFRSSAPSSGPVRGFYPPSSPSDMGRFAAALIGRYGPNGSFWAENPSIPKLPIRAWQVWNEPNLPVYWPTGPNPRAYTRLLKGVARGIKGADRGATVLTAGIPNSKGPGAIGLDKYIGGLYRAGARSAFDALAINPYDARSRGVIQAATRIRALMNRYRDRRGRLWITEIGWATSGPPHPFLVGPDGQAARIRALLPALSRLRGALGLDHVFYYQMRDPALGPGDKDYWGLHVGLFDESGDPKPGWDAFVETARGLAGA